MKHRDQWLIIPIDCLAARIGNDRINLDLFIFYYIKGCVSVLYVIPAAHRPSQFHLTYTYLQINSVSLRSCLANCACVLGLFSSGATRTKDARELLYARQRVVVTAKAFGLQAIDLVYIDYKDVEGLRQQAREGALMGFTGKVSCFFIWNLPLFLQVMTWDIMSVTVIYLWFLHLLHIVLICCSYFTFLNIACQRASLTSCCKRHTGSSAFTPSALCYMWGFFVLFFSPNENGEWTSW